MSFEKELLEEIPLVLLNFYKLVSFCHYAGIVLGTEEKKFSIYGHVSMGLAFQGVDSEPSISTSLPSLDFPQERPLTHDVLNFIFSGFDIRVLRVVINDYKENIFYTRIFLEQKQGNALFVADIDARPSDSIPLALAHKVPILCAKAVFDAVIPYEED
ncbi:bifunctional nuclease family protein [Chlamydia sp. 17-3921]|uniref:bifunctional nuclease family protein n=1 Tax=Chlamydia sp. 17-3921 TaxID=2675798 RepID=UPI001919E372|nr:bifunctional nuclease family protein [Chlamydia sp. 17-3921]